MTKLILQIPCFNEEGTLAITLADLPRQLPGVDCIEWLVIDDGSRDRTVDVAKEGGVDHIVSLPTNQGLAKAFMVGLEKCLELGADIIVNLDADNQYCAADIPKLLHPILNHEAEMVIGARPISTTSHFSPIKKLLQKLGSWVVRLASRTEVDDCPSGFRAISRRVAYQLNVFNEYTYTLETIIQAGQKGIRVASVPIRTNRDLRPSRLVKSIRSYVTRSITTIVRIAILYRPLPFFFSLGVIPILTGIGLFGRWLVLAYDHGGRVPSLVVGSVCLGIGSLFCMMGLLADLLSANRKILEEIQVRLRQQSIEATRSNGDTAPPLAAESEATESTTLPPSRRAA